MNAQVFWRKISDPARLDDRAEASGEQGKNFVTSVTGGVWKILFQDGSEREALEILRRDG
jgi:hypothetical protein